MLARFDYNVNLAPFVTTKIINYTSAPEHEGESLALGNLYLSLSDAGEIVLTHRNRPGTKRQDISAQIARTPELATTKVHAISGEGVEL